MNSPITRCYWKAVFKGAPFSLILSDTDHDVLSTSSTSSGSKLRSFMPPSSKRLIALTSTVFARSIDLSAKLEVHAYLGLVLAPVKVVGELVDVPGQRVDGHVA